jgi:O-Antigen ligase
VKPARARAATPTLEAAWLAALVLVPLFVAVDSARPFDPAKAAAVRVLAVVLVAGWAVARLREPPRTHALLHRNPLALPALALLAVAAVSTATSIAPGVSLEGGFARGQGLTTIAAYPLIFLVTAAAMRSRLQIERTVTVALAGAVPVAVYALVQRYSLDPLAWRGTSPTAVRPGSTLGGPGFLAGYLVVLAPLALARLSAHAEAVPARRVRALAAGAGLLCAGASVAAWRLLAPAPAAGLVPAGELRSDHLRFAAAVACTAALVVPWALAAWRSRERRLLVVGVYASLLGLLAAALFATASRAAILALLVAGLVFGLLLASVRRSPRLALASVAVAALVAVAVPAFGLATAPSVPAEPRGLLELEQGTAAAEPRGLLELEQGTGRVRLALWRMGLDAALARRPLRSSDGSDRLRFLRPLLGYGPDSTLAVLGQFRTAELARLESRRPDRVHNQTIDVLVQLGTAGMAAYLLFLAALFLLGLRTLGLARRDGCPGDGRAVLAAGTVGALVAHAVESQGGIVTSASATLFWILAAALVALRRLAGDRSADAAGGRSVEPVLAGLALGAVAFLLVNAGSAARAGGGWLETLLHSLVLKDTLDGARLSGAPWVLASAPLAFGALGAFEQARAQERRALVPAALLAAFALPQALLATRAAAGEVLAAAVAPALFLLLALAALVLLATPGAARGRRRPLAAGAVVAAAAGGVLMLGLRQVAADATLAAAQGPSAADAEAWTARARRVLPLHDYPWTYVAEARLEQARSAQPPARRRRYLDRAATAELEARSANPFDPEATFRVARFLHEAARLDDDVARRARFERSAREYGLALRLAPNDAAVDGAHASLLLEFARFLDGRGEHRPARALRSAAARQAGEALRLEPDNAVARGVLARLRSAP